MPTVGFWSTAFIVTLPASLFLICFCVWWKTRHAKGIVSKAANGASLSLMVGFGAVVIMLLVFNFIPGTQDVSVVSNVQGRLINFNDWLQKWSKLSLKQSLIALATLWVAGQFLPHWKPLSRFLKLKSYVGRTVLVIGTIASFTFTTAALGSAAMSQAHTIIFARYQNAEVRRQEASKRQLAAQVVLRAVLKMDEKTKQDYRNFFLALQAAAHAPYAVIASDRVFTRVAEEYAREDVGSPTKPIIVPDTDPSDSEIPDSEPNVRDPYKQQTADLHKAETNADNAEQ